MSRPVVSSGRLKRRRRNRRLLLVGAVVVVLAAVAGLLVWLSQAAFLRVTTITVTGVKTVSSGNLQAYAERQLQGQYAWLFARDNIFLYPRESIQKGIESAYPTLHQVDVHAKDFHTVEIAVAERSPAALWCDTTCYYMDETGLVYAPAPAFSDMPYITYAGATNVTAQAGLRQYLTRDQFQSLAALVAALNAKEPDNKIKQVAVDDSGDARTYFQDNFLLIFSTKDDGGDVFERFVLALQSSDFAGHQLSDFEYLDLRFGDKLYYKLK